PIRSLSQRKAGCACRDEEFGIQAGELAQYQNQSKSIDNRGYDELHQDYRRVEKTAVIVRAMNKDCNPCCDGADQRNVGRQRPSLMREAYRTGQLQKNPEEKCVRYDDDQKGKRN